MADTPVAPTDITTLPTAPARTDPPATFVTRADAFVAALPTFGTQSNSLADNVFFNAESAFDSATEASADASDASASALAAENSALASAGSANYVGAYSTLTGAKTAGISVDHLGAFWLLNANTADVTADVPGTSGKWSRLFGTGQIYQRATNIKLVAEDSGKIIEYTSGTFTQTFDPAATLKSGWHVYLRNVGANVTLDPDGSETIDQGFSGPGQLYLVICDGTSAFRVITQDESARWGESEAFEASGTFTVKKSGWHRVKAVGAGGSGAIAWHSNSANELSATGGGAGGFALKEFYAIAGTAYTIVIGTGGAAVSRTTDGATSGNAGGNTTVSGFGVSLTANGGAGGTASVTATTLTGASGGTATGGSLNVTGGASGGVVNTGTSDTQGASGGGAVGINGTGYASGLCTVSGTSAWAASGGAGTGGASGTATSTASQASASGGGGSMGGSSAAANTSTAGGVGAVSLTTMQLNGVGSSSAIGSGTSASATGNGGAGVGGGRYGSAPGISGIYAGGSANCAATSSTVTSGAGGRGGGGGAITVLQSGGAVSCTSGAGGSGLVIVEY